MGAIGRLIFQAFIWIAKRFLNGIWSFCLKLKNWFFDFWLEILSLFSFFKNGKSIVGSIVIAPYTAIGYVIIGILYSIWVAFGALILFVYKQISNLINMLNSASVGSASYNPNSPDLLNLSWQVFKSCGMWDAIVDVFNLWSFFFMFLLWVYTAKYIARSLDMFREFLKDFLEFGSTLSIADKRLKKIGHNKKPF